GTDGMGTEHCRAFLRMAKDGRADVRLVALSDVCEPRPGHALKACREYGADHPSHAYRDDPQLLPDPPGHAVLMATPEHWHARMVEDAIAAGKDVYVEKPMTLRLPEALRLREVVRANPDAVVVVGTQYTTYPGYQEAQRLIAEGAIGKPVWSQTS